MPQTERLGIEIGFETKNQAAVKLAEQNIANVGKAAKTATVSMAAADKSTAKLRTSFSALNNIVRDAPYGINGVANNITQLGDALFGATLAAQAVGFGLSLLVTGLVSLSQKYGSLGNAVNALLGKQDKQAEIQRAVNAAVLQGSKDAQTEAVSLSSLYRATQNVNVPLTERNRLVDELQSRYPSYFGNLSNEAILAGKAASAYRNLQNNILLAAQARAIEKRIAENSEKLLDLDTKREDILNKITKASQALAKEQQGATVRASQAASSINSYGVVSASANLSVVKLRGAVQSLVDDLKENGAAVVDVNNANDALLKKLDELTIKGGSGVFTSLTESAKEAKKEIADIGFRLLQTQQLVFPAIKPKIPVEMQLVGVEQAQKNLKNQLKPLNATLTKEVNQITINTEEILQAGAARIASGVATAVGGIIGGALTLREGLNSIIVVMADFITQLGESLIAAGTATIAANALATNPATAIAAGFLAVAAGAAVRAALDKAPSFATGGTALGPQFALIGDNPARKEHILSDAQLDRIAGGGAREVRVIGVLRGQDIALTNERATGTIGRVN